MAFDSFNKGFHFLVPFQEWLHANPEKTLADACSAYPGMTLEKATQLWKAVKSD